MKSPLTITRDKTGSVIAQLQRLTGNDVLVGIPSENSGREDEAINNAARAYVHEFGSPAANIPARPFLRPGVASIQDEAARRMGAAAKRVLAGGGDAIEPAMHAVGMLAVSAVRRLISAGIEPPLSRRTLEARANRPVGTGVGIRKGARAELESRAAGNAPSTEYAKPLIDTGSMYRAITYVIRRRK